MRSATKRVPRRKPRASNYAPLWQALGPLLLSVVLTPIAVQGASILALSGPSGLRLLFPWVNLLRDHLLPLSGPQIERFSEWTMWLMLPVYAVIFIAMRRISSPLSGLLFLVLLHGLAVAVAVALR